MGKFIPANKGDKYGKLTVVEDLGVFIKEGTKTPRHYVKCICSCKDRTIVIVDFDSLKNGSTTSCGCYGKEQRLKVNTKHGLSHSRIKRIYNNMHSRCDNPNTPKFKNHGGRGIKVCDEWSGKNGFINFYKWAINNGYSDDLTLDRQDNNGNYKPSNCRWVDQDTQHENRRVTRYFEINGESKMAKNWCKEYGININTFWQRVLQGLSGEELIKPPSKMTSRNTTGIVGVTFRKDLNKWNASIQYDYKHYSLGVYDKFEDAVIARLKGEKKYIGKYTDNYKRAKEIGILDNIDFI